MKTIADFVEGKIRRSELEDELRFERGGAPHPTLGAAEGVLHGPAGRARLYADGLVLEPDRAVEYARIVRVLRSPALAGPEGPVHLVDLALDDGSTARVTGSASGAEVLHATLRWIGHALLRRNIA